MRSQVSVKRRDVVTMHIDIDMPEELREAIAFALRDSETPSTDRSVDHVIVVNIGGTRVGTVNPFSRQWRHVTDRVESY